MNERPLLTTDAGLPVADNGGAGPRSEPNSRGGLVEAGCPAAAGSRNGNIGQPCLDCRPPIGENLI